MAAIAGAVLGVLVFAAVIVILVVVGVAIAHHRKKKQPGKLLLCTSMHACKYMHVRVYTCNA